MGKRQANGERGRAGGQTLIPLNGKQIALMGGELLLLSSRHLSSEDFSSLWPSRACKERGEPLPLSAPQFALPAGGEPPAAAPGTSLGTPHGFSLG